MCDCVITGTLIWARTRWPANDTRWLDLLVHGAAVREVRGSKPGVATTLLLTTFRVNLVKVFFIIKLFHIQFDVINDINQLKLVIGRPLLVSY